jgi:hypothetical protein
MILYCAIVTTDEDSEDFGKRKHCEVDTDSTRHALDFEVLFGRTLSEVPEEEIFEFVTKNGDIIICGKDYDDVMLVADLREGLVTIH